MKIFIKETGEVRNLSAVDDDELDYIPELIEEGGLPHNPDGLAVMTQTECNWWTACLLHHQEDARQIRELAGTLDVPVASIVKQIQVEMTGRDTDYEHAVTLAVLEEFRAGLIR